MISTAELQRGEPFLRWAGGKQALVQRISNLLPTDFSQRNYHEPFLGAGSVFFSLNVSCAFLSDSNNQLINCYRMIRDNPLCISQYLAQHKRQCNEKYYYQVRDIYNKSRPSVAQAARFIFLNRTSFNGIFRVNEQGQYNVPYGWKKNPKFPTSKCIFDISKRLKTVKLTSQDYLKSFCNTNKHSFIFVDPPYPPISSTAYFTHYTKERFSAKDHETLASELRSLDRIGCKIMVTNADTDYIRQLYKSFLLVKVPVRRFVTCKRIKHRVNEIILTNYEVFNDK